MSVRIPPLLKFVAPILLLGGIVVGVRTWPVEVEGHRVEAGVVVAEVLGIGVLESAREVRVSFVASVRYISLPWHER